MIRACGVSKKVGGRGEAVIEPAPAKEIPDFALAFLKL